MKYKHILEQEIEKCYKNNDIEIEIMFKERVNITTIVSSTGYLFYYHSL